jgi:hypothetical protein
MGKTIWTDGTPKKVINETVNTAFGDLTGKYRPTGNTAKFIRIVGQSGTGKSTQGKPAVVSKYGGFITLSIADFVKYHPKGETDREKTNGFCLRVLTGMLYKLIKVRADIVLDMTLLTARYETALLRRLTKQKYEPEYIIMAVPKAQSDKFIKKREKETGRIVSTVSAEFFDRCLQTAIKVLIRQIPNAECIMWSAYDLQPIYYGKIKNALPPFMKARKELRKLKYSQSELLHAKIEFIKKN